MKWKFLNAKECFQRYQGQWDKLNEEMDNHVLLDSKFWEFLIKFFSDKKKILLGISESLEYPGMALFEYSGYGMWRTFQPSQAPMGPILLPNKNNIKVQLNSLLRSFPVLGLGLGILHQDPHYTCFDSLLTQKNVETVYFMDTARIPLQGEFEAYWNLRSKSLKESMRKQNRRLQKEGISVHLDVYEVPADINQCIGQYAYLEETGWKGREGTAVTTKNRQGLFYKEMLGSFCAKKEAVVYSLRFNEEVVAQKICLRRKEMIVFLKMAYNEKYKRYSPGYIIQYELLDRLFKDSTFQYAETYGRVRPGWTDKWTNDFRGMYHVNFYYHPIIRTTKTILKSILNREMSS